MFGTVNDGNVGYSILLVKYLTLNMQGVGVVVALSKHIRLSSMLDKVLLIFVSKLCPDE